MIGIQEGWCVSGVRAAGRIEALRLQLQISQSMYPDFMPEYVWSGTFMVSSRSRTAAGTSPQLPRPITSMQALVSTLTPLLPHASDFTALRMPSATRGDLFLAQPAGSRRNARN